MRIQVLTQSALKSTIKYHIKIGSNSAFAVEKLTEIYNLELKLIQKSQAIKIHKVNFNFQRLVITQYRPYCKYQVQEYSVHCIALVYRAELRSLISP